MPVNFGISITLKINHFNMHISWSPYCKVGVTITYYWYTLNIPTMYPQTIPPLRTVACNINRTAAKTGRRNVKKICA
jgi:hypothetical protein